ncbi:flavoprotein [Streptomyces sp. V1I6]|nr:flavoprotein [Streptomyces sp. V1I6]
MHGLVRHQYKLPSQPDVLPPPDAMFVAPLTNNTLAKWATAFSDTLASG